MDIRQLRCYRTVYQTANYAQAARALFLSRQAVRDTVKTLEHELGTPLFTTAPNGRLVPTEFGDWLAERSLPVIEAFDSLEGSVRERLDIALDMPSVGFSHEMLETIEPDELLALEASYAGIYGDYAEHNVRHGTDRELLEDLRSGSLDFACVLARPEDAEGFDRHLHRTRPLWCLLPRDHPAADGAAVRIEDLRRDALMLRPEGNYGSDLLLGACRAAGFDPRVEVVPAFDRAAAARQRARRLVSYLLGPQQGIEVEGFVARPFADEGMVWRHWSLRRRGAPDTYAGRRYWRQSTSAVYDDPPEQG